MTLVEYAFIHDVGIQIAFFGRTNCAEAGPLVLLKKLESVELTNDGFMLVYEGGMKLGLKEFQGTIFYMIVIPHEFFCLYDAVPGGYSGMALPEDVAKVLYDDIVGHLLLEPPRAE